MFFTYFLVSFIISSVTVAVILLIRKVFEKQLSAKWKYNLWFLFLIVLTIPLMPNDLVDVSYRLTWDVQQNNEIRQSIVSAQSETFNNKNWLQDFSLNVTRFDLSFLNQVFACIWVIGIIVMNFLTIKAWLELREIKKSVTSLQNKEVLYLFEQCKQKLHISRKLIIGESPLIRSPLTFGVFKTYVVLPVHFDKWLSMEEIEYILLHELNHYKYKDILTNYLIVFYQIVYWFHPLVWIAFREMKLDREIACDSAVLHTLKKHCYAEYGKTIIRFVDRVSRPTYFTLVNQLNGSKQQIKKRIEEIAFFTTETRRLKFKSIIIFLFLGAFVASQFPIFSVMAYDDQRYDFDGKRTRYEDLGKYFAGYEGSFVLYDLQADQYRIYNKNKSTVRVSPNSTYKIYSALFALESKVITKENSTLKWSGKQYPYEAWNRDQDLSTAMKSSVNWYFHELDKKVHQDQIQHYVEQINYGNTNLSSGISQYWIESSLKISPIEQVQLLKSFYQNEWGFQKQHIQTVKQAIQLEEKAGVRLSGKTGTGTVNGKNINGWFIGYVETKTDTYFFATNIQNKDHANGLKAVEITKLILSEKGLF